MSKWPWPHSAVRITFSSPVSLARRASQLADAMARARLRCGDDPLRPSELDSSLEALHLSDRLRLDQSQLVDVGEQGDIPWYRRPPAWMRSGTKS